MNAGERNLKRPIRIPRRSERSEPNRTEPNRIEPNRIEQSVEQDEREDERATVPRAESRRIAVKRVERTTRDSGSSHTSGMGGSDSFWASVDSFVVGRYSLGSLDS